MEITALRNGTMMQQDQHSQPMQQAKELLQMDIIGHLQLVLQMLKIVDVRDLIIVPLQQHLKMELIMFIVMIKLIIQAVVQFAYSKRRS